jgi:hypothetical protein
MNQAQFLADQRRYFAGSYDGFRSFGGPSVHFHAECLRAGSAEFLSKRHVEMLYATLTAWGMHRMGDPSKTKTKLTDWSTFHGSVTSQRDVLERFRAHRMLDMSEQQYSDALLALKPCCASLKLSVSDATVVVNSKTLFHLLPEFVPPIDRQYTIRFFTKPPDRWLDAKGGVRVVFIPKGFDSQFELFRRICVDIKRLADQVEPALLEHERCQHGVTPPKAMDNAIVNYVRTVSREQ